MIRPCVEIIVLGLDKARSYPWILVSEIPIDSLSAVVPLTSGLPRGDLLPSDPSIFSRGEEKEEEKEGQPSSHSLRR